MSGNHLQIPALQWWVLRRTSTSSEIEKYFFLLQTGVTQIFNMLLSRLIQLFLFILCITCTKIKSVFIPTKTFAHSGNPALNKPRPSLYNVSRLAELHLERPAAVWPPDAFPGQKYSFSPALSHPWSCQLTAYGTPRMDAHVAPGPVTMATAVGADPTFTNPVMSD